MVLFSVCEDFKVLFCFGYSELRVYEFAGIDVVRCLEFADSGVRLLQHSLMRRGTDIGCREVCSHIPLYYGSFHFLFHYPYKPQIYHSSFHLIFHYPNITPIYNSRVYQDPKP